MKHYSTYSLLLLNICSFLFIDPETAWHGGPSRTSTLLEWGANFLPATQDGQWWRLFTSMFLHFSIWHLLMNMWALWDAGRQLEKYSGSLRILLIYFGSGLVGSLCSLSFNSPPSVSAGASGAICGLYGAVVVEYWLKRKELAGDEFRFWFFGALLFCTASIAIGFVVEGIDNAAHLGGLMMGIALGVVSSPANRLQLQVRGFAFFLCLMVIGVAWAKQPKAGYRWSEEKLVHDGIAEFLHKDSILTSEWKQILGSSSDEGASFNELADLFELHVASQYESTFETLSQLPEEEGLPSHDLLIETQNYAKRQRDLSNVLVKQFRARGESAH